MPGRLGAGPARPGAKPATAAVKRTGASAKSAPAAKPASRPKTAIPAKRSGTHGGQLTIAILAGLAIGLVMLLIYSFARPTPWAFDRPEAQLPSLQQKHTLY